MSIIHIEMAELFKIIEQSFEKNTPIILKVRGNSMFPLLRNGIDSFKLAPISGKPHKKDIVLYLRDNNQFVLHRIIKIKKDYYLITGDNQSVLEKVRFDQLKGYVTHIYKNNKTIDCKKSKRYRFYVFIWCFNLFLRKCMLKVIRKVKKMNTNDHKPT